MKYQYRYELRMYGSSSPHPQSQRPAVGVSEFGGGHQQNRPIAVGAVSCCQLGGCRCGDRYVTFLCDLFGGYSTTAPQQSDGFADASISFLPERPSCLWSSKPHQ